MGLEMTGLGRITEDANKNTRLLGTTCNDNILDKSHQTLYYFYKSKFKITNFPR